MKGIQSNGFLPIIAQAMQKWKNSMVSLQV